MSDIAIRQDQQLDIPTGTEPATAQLVQWAQAAHAAHSLAEGICNTQVAPQAYRGKPAEAAAAILAGAEVGLSPIASLRAFDNIQGTPAPKAMTLRAIVQGLGHTIEIVESDDDHCVVRGKRKGSDEWQHCTWTVERAQQMGLLGKEQWKKNRRMMLVARGTSEMARWIASDAIMGMPYTVEEIRDQGTTAVAERPRPARIVSAADFIEQPAEQPEPKGSYLVDPGETADLSDVDPERVISWIANADRQAELDEIKEACRRAGIRDQQVLDAWAARSAQLAEAA